MDLLIMIGKVENKLNTEDNMTVDFEAIDFVRTKNKVKLFEEKKKQQEEEEKIQKENEEYLEEIKNKL